MWIKTRQAVKEHNSYLSFSVSIEETKRIFYLEIADVVANNRDVSGFLAV
jgi:hypothetical protein